MSRSMYRVSCPQASLVNNTRVNEIFDLSLSACRLVVKSLRSSVLVLSEPKGRATVEMFESQEF